MAALKGGAKMEELPENEQQAVNTYREKLEYIRRWKLEIPGIPRSERARDLVRQIARLNISSGVMGQRELAKMLGCKVESVALLMQKYGRYYYICLAEAGREFDRELNMQIEGRLAHSVRKNLELVTKCDNKLEEIMDLPTDSTKVGELQLKAIDRIKKQAGMEHDKAKSATGPAVSKAFAELLAAKVMDKLAQPEAPKELPAQVVDVEAI